MSSTPPGEPNSPSPERRRAVAPRSLADELRSWPDDDLLALLRSRPDLAVPRPNEFATLVARAASRAAVQRAIDGLDTAELQVAEVLAALAEPAAPGEVSRRWGAPAGPTLARLRALALVWGPPRALRLVRAARDVLGPHPAGLGPPLADALGRRSPQRLTQLLEDLGLPPAGDPDTALERLAGHLSRADVLEEMLAEAPAGVRQVLDRLTWGPPVGQVAQADRAVRRSCANGPVEWLLAHGILAVADSAHVVLPREVGLALRGGRVHRACETRPPALVARARPLRAVSGTAAGAAAEAVRLVEALGEHWGAAPPSVLRAGGIGVRELHRTAVALDVDDPTAAFVTELAYVAGLIADDGEADPRWAPTPAFDSWQAAGTGRRWAELATAWLHTTRCAQLVGTRGPRDTPRASLGGDLDRAAAPAIRWWVLQTLAEPGSAGSEPDRLPAVDPESLRDRLDWLSPRRSGAARDALVGWALDDAARLGVVGAGALAPHGRVLLDRPDEPAAAAKALDAALPEPVDHVLLQADLTAVAPGPPEPELARELALLADVESRGGATVYRFSATSVRRALDAGRTAGDVLALLATRSRTEVPQPLAYLVTDVARRHGRVRVGAAQSFVRADDESVIAVLLAERRAAPLRLRRLAPTVLAAQAPAPAVLDLLRELGLAPVAESPDGDVVVSRRERYRTGPRTPPRPAAPLPSPLGPPPSRATDAALATVVATVRAADRLAEQAAGPAQSPGSGQGRGGGTGQGPGTGQGRGGGTGRGKRAGSEGLGGGPVTGSGTGQAAPPGRVGAPELPAGETREVIARLRQAADRQEAVWIGYTDADGNAAPRLVQPLQVDGGRMLAVDRASQRIRTFVVHRVTGVTADSA
jgi:hypothetical protein